jgi:hypothetical protein
VVPLGAAIALDHECTVIVSSTYAVFIVVVLVTVDLFTCIGLRINAKY